ncbi:MAG: methionyl-tRNA formyltransferase [Acidobacteria bacterium]|nr:methionyl-tRNA formyltransferase [Acidobacteriota bacterium]
MGTPAFAVPTLEALLEAGVEVAGVVTQPDRPAGRGQQPVASPVKRLAVERGLAVFQPLKIKDPEAVEYVRRLGPDVIVVVGYGQIIPRAVFDSPPLGTINVHASLLPKYRGAAPIQWAIANGETVTGITTMRIEAGLDTGDILLQRECPIGPEETAPELSARLAKEGAALLIETLRCLERGAITPRKQDPTQASHAPLIKKEDGRADWAMGARQIANRVRAFDPWPGVYTTFRGHLLHLRKVRVVEGSGTSSRAVRPGALDVDRHSLRVACGEGWLELVELQPEGKKRLTAQEFINGHRPTSKDVLGGENR